MVVYQARQPSRSVADQPASETQAAGALSAACFAARSALAFSAACFSASAFAAALLELHARKVGVEPVRIGLQEGLPCLAIAGRGGLRLAVCATTIPAVVTTRGN